MRPTAHDACFLISERATRRIGITSATSDHTPLGMTCMQVDDTLNAGNLAFIELEDGNLQSSNVS